MSIKNLIFDFGGVVIPLSPEKSWRRFESMGIKDARQQMGIYGQTGIFRQCEDGSIDAATFQHLLAVQAQEQSNYFGNETPHFTFEECQHAWCGYIDRVEQYRLDNLLQLKEHYNVILLSNTNPFMVDFIETDQFSPARHPINYYFHRVFYSCQMKDYKPSLTIFQKLLDEACIRAEESVFLDDGPANVEAARQLGIHGLLVPGNEDWMPSLRQFLQQHDSLF